MRKNPLTVALVAGLAGIAGTANAVQVNPDGTGQVLLYPYYTALDGNNTLFTIVNTTDEVKAVKVRFREGKNSKDARDFNLYLSPFDVWAAAVTDNGGVANVSNGDISCTVPNSLIGSNVDFTNLAYSGANELYQDIGLDRTLEGHIEVIEMGVVVDGANTFASDATHGATQDCLSLENSWRAGGVWFAAPNTDINPPTGGIMGSGYIVNVNGGTMVGFPAVTLDDIITAANHQDPTSAEPQLTSISNSTIARGLVGSGAGAATLYAAQMGTPIAAASAVLMAQSVMFDYTVDPALQASTDIVVTFPTRYGIVPMDFSAANLPFNPPFQTDTTTFDASGIAAASAANQLAGGPGLCEEFFLQHFDREEAFPTPGTPGVGFSPGVTVLGFNPELCYETNVIQFQETLGNGLSVFGSQNVLSFEPASNDGWGFLVFSDNSLAVNDVAQFGIDIVSNKDVDGAGLLDDATIIGGRTISGAGVAPIAGTTVSFSGLPTIGFTAQKVVNGTLNLGAGPVFSAYAGAIDHRYQRSITIS